MSNLNPDEFENILNTIKHRIDGFAECGAIRAIESNFNTKAMVFKTKGTTKNEGTIIVGEDKGEIAVDISMPDGAVRSFILHDNNKMDSIDSITGWLKTIE